MPLQKYLSTSGGILCAIGILFDIYMMKIYITSIFKYLELFKYKKKFGKSPLLNLDEDAIRKVSDSFSNNYQVTDLTSFMN